MHKRTSSETACRRLPRSGHIGVLMPLACPGRDTFSGPGTRFRATFSTSDTFSSSGRLGDPANVFQLQVRENFGDAFSSSGKPPERVFEDKFSSAGSSSGKPRGRVFELQGSLREAFLKSGHVFELEKTSGHVFERRHARATLRGKCPAEVANITAQFSDPPRSSETFWRRSTTPTGIAAEGFPRRRDQKPHLIWKNKIQQCCLHEFHDIRSESLCTLLRKSGP
jgi:hypothetical protein